jgi:hypothetical protein
MFPYNKYFILIVTTTFLAFSLAVTASTRIVGNRIDTDCSREVRAPPTEFSFIRDVGEHPDGVPH